MHTLDLQLEIGPGAGQMYPVTARAPGGDAATSMHLPLTFEELDHQLAVVNDAVLASSAVARRARTLWRQALDLYERIAQPYSIGVVHRELARIAPADEIRAGHVAAARIAWTKVHRMDLLAALDEEFPDSAS